MFLKITFLIMILIIYKVISSNFIKLEHFKIKTDKDIKLRIVHISDVHIREKEYSRIDKILKKIKSVNPDIIVITGDLLDSCIKDDSLLYFSTKVSSIAKTIAVPGNHEQSYPDYLRWKETLNSCGIIVLENNSTEEEQGIVFMGLKENKLYNPSLLKDIENVDNKYIILLSHRPELFKKHLKSSYLINPDLILSGHAHGGQFRLFNRGLYSPGQGIFPEYTSGKYQLQNLKSTLIVSRGLGHCSIPIRFNNTFHIPVIELY